MWGHGINKQQLIYTKLAPQDVNSDSDMMVSNFINFTIESFEFRKLR